MSSITSTITALPITSTSSVTMQNGTYWESLSEQDRRYSVNEHKSRFLGKKIGWGYAGPVRDKWNNEIYPAILIIINNRKNYEKIFGKTNTRLTRPCSLYMVGDRQAAQSEDKPWERAEPTIVAISSNQGIAQKICDLLRDSTSLKSLNLGFNFMFFKDKALKLNAGDGSGNKLYAQADSLCGLPIWTPGWPLTIPPKYRRATIGGVVIINGLSFVLTAAHVFYSDDWDNEDDNTSTSSNTSMEDLSVMNSSESSQADWSVSQTSDRLLDHLRGKDMDVFQACRDMKSGQPFSGSDYLAPDHLERFGYLSQSSMPSDLQSFICPVMDWALIRPAIPHPCKINTATTPAGNIISLTSASADPPIGSVLVFAGSSGVFETNATGRIEGIVLPGSTRMIEVWTIDSASQPGDCGSWVVDPELGSIHGMLVATSDDAGESYLIPAKDLLDSIKSKWPAGTDIKFPSITTKDMTTEISETIRSSDTEHTQTGTQWRELTGSGTTILPVGTTAAGLKSWTTAQTPAQIGNSKTVKQLLAATSGMKADAIDEYGRTPLSWAAERGHTEVFKLLVDRNDAHADFMDYNRRTPLSWAAEKGHTEVVKLLVDFDGVRADSRDDQDRTPLSWAAEKGHIDVIKMLIYRDVRADSRDKQGRTPLSWAAEKGHTEVVKLLVDRDDVQAESMDYSRRTPLSWAAEKGHIEVVKLLIERDDVHADFTGYHRRTPLSWASEKGHIEVVKLLIERDDVQADSMDYSSRTPLSWAAEKGHTEVVKLLVDRNDVQADSMDYSRRTPLSWAAEKGHVAVIKLLIDRDVRAYLRDKQGRTPISWAAENGHKEVVELLVNRDDSHADWRDGQGRTPLSWAAQKGHTEIVKLLVDQNNVYANSRDEQGQTPLSWAAENGNIEVVKLLTEVELRKGPGLGRRLGKWNVPFADSEDKQGQTPSSWAAEKGRKELIQLQLNRDTVRADLRDK